MTLGKSGSVLDTFKRSALAIAVSAGLHLAAFFVGSSLSCELEGIGLGATHVACPSGANFLLVAAPAILCAGFIGAPFVMLALLRRGKQAAPVLIAALAGVVIPLITYDLLVRPTQLAYGDAPWQLWELCTQLLIVPAFVFIMSMILGRTRY